MPTRRRKGRTHDRRQIPCPVRRRVRRAALARHPVFERSVAILAEWGVRVVLDPARLPDATEGTAVFPWDEVRGELARLR